MITNNIIHEQTYNIQGCTRTRVLGVLRVLRVWVWVRVRVRVQLFFIIRDEGTWVCQTLFLIILLYL